MKKRIRRVSAEQRNRFTVVSEEMAHRVIGLVASSSIGMTSRELAEAMGVSHGTAVDRLSFLKKAGDVFLLGPRGINSRWCTDSNRGAVLAYMRQKELADKQCRNSYYVEYRARKKKEQSMSAVEAPADKAKPRPIRKLGPASVWEWAKVAA